MPLQSLESAVHVPVFDVPMGAHGRGEVHGLRALPRIEETAPFDRELCLALELSFDHGIMARSLKHRSKGEASLTFEPVDIQAIAPEFSSIPRYN